MSVSDCKEYKIDGWASQRSLLQYREGAGLVFGRPIYGAAGIPGWTSLEHYR